LTGGAAALLAAWLTAKAALLAAWMTGGAALLAAWLTGGAAALLSTAAVSSWSSSSSLGSAQGCISPDAKMA